MEIVLSSKPPQLGTARGSARCRWGEDELTVCDWQSFPLGARASGKPRGGCCHSGAVRAASATGLWGRSVNPPKADVSETGPLHACGTPLGTTENQCLGMSSEMAEQIALYKGGVHTLLNLPPTRLTPPVCNFSLQHVSVYLKNLITWLTFIFRTL